jgi:hypothetical protein
MYTWNELLADIRSDLQDTGETPRFPDKMLFLYAKDAIRDYSQWFPRRVDQLKLTTDPDGGIFYPLPTGFIEDIFVEAPTSRFLERRQEHPGLRYMQYVRPFYYWVEGGNLYLDCKTYNAELLLTYYATHPVPASETDETFVITVPDLDIELVRLYVKAKAYGQTRSRQANLDRFKPRGNREDNPLRPEFEDLMTEYEQKIAERSTGGVIRLFRSGRSR